MTPEQRLTKIENAIQALTDVQARHDARIEALAEVQSRHDAQLEKQNAAIRDLVVASRKFLDSQKVVARQIRAFTRAQKRRMTN